MENQAAFSEKRRLTLTIIAISVMGMVTGLFLGGGVLPFRVPPQQYIEKTFDSSRILNVVHAHEEEAQHEHKATTVVTVMETSPHGYVHDFLAALTPGLFSNQGQGVQGQAPNEVTIWAREFHPNSLSVPAGTKVTWINKDEEEHTVNADNGLFGGLLPGLGTYSYTFNEPGRYTYFCEPHPVMTGVVIVK